MSAETSTTASAPPDAGPDAQRLELLALLREGGRGAAGRQAARVRELFLALERATPADLTAPGALQLLEGVWELRWSSSNQPYLAVAPWIENLQLLAPSQGRAMNLLRLPGPLAPLAGIAVEAAITVNSTEATTTGANSRQRVQVRFQRGGWLGPRLGERRLQLLRGVRQPFPAWLDITVLDPELRLCRGNAGTLFALLRRPDLTLEDLLPAT
ncbi:PAP/fibrillin family protein [Cyanobium sp. CH-040]|uniref:PAP/fibrillin family protein n=1 Tax=Cyanobium sp. CH-040 TaxID=2823708 RepID=UPI0020CBDB77|nr:PAP/fibrillin family protein [Cyanobium sp. CH-040]